MNAEEIIGEVDAQELNQFFDQHLIVILVIAALLIALYVVAPRMVHFAVRRTLVASTDDLGEGGVTVIELEKRSRTIESLIVTLIRATVVVSLGIIVIGLLGVWSLLTGVALLLAALTLAGQSIVLDYLMGILIVVEGTYFEGDNISAGDPSWQIKGTVEDVGLRRTVIRGPDGTVHSISNGLMRQVSNRTRIFAAAEVRIGGIREEDLDRALEIMDRVGQDLAEDPEFADFIMEAHSVRFMGDPDDLGWSATMRGKVIAAERWVVGTEVRRRLNRAFLDEDIELNKRGVAPRVARPGGNPPPPYTPEPDDS